MRRLFVALLIGVCLVGLTLAACGGPSLTSQELKAVKAVEANINSFGTQSYGDPVVVGTIDKDNAGNKATFVYVPTVDPSTKQKWSLVVVIVETQDGKLVFADADIPSGIVTVTTLQ